MALFLIIIYHESSEMSLKAAEDFNTLKDMDLKYIWTTGERLKEAEFSRIYWTTETC